MNTMSNATPTYGAVSSGSADQDNNAFTEDNFRFLQDKPLTWKERSHKYLLIGMPIVIALGILSGTAFLLTHDFSQHHGDKVVSTTPALSPTSTSTSSSTSSKASPTAPTKTKTEEDNDPSSSCEAHPQCGGLTGFCCPTQDGLVLECCKDKSESP